MPGFVEVGELAKSIGTLNAVLIFVVFVQALVVFYLLRMLQNREKKESIVNNKILEFFIDQGRPKDDLPVREDVNRTILDKPLDSEIVLVDDIVIMSCSGYIMGGPNDSSLHGSMHEILRNQLDKGYKKFILDLSRVDWMNSAGLGVLISALTTIRNRDGRMRLIATEKITMLLTITKLITVIEIASSVEEAIALFKKDGEAKQQGESKT